MCARSASLAQDKRKDTTFFRHNATMLRRLSRRGVTASRASFRTDDIRTRAVASSSPAFLNEDDKDGGKTIEIIESNLVRPLVRSSCRAAVIFISRRKTLTLTSFSPSRSGPRTRRTIENRRGARARGALNHAQRSAQSLSLGDTRIRVFRLARRSRAGVARRHTRIGEERVRCGAGGARPRDGE